MNRITNHLCKLVRGGWEPPRSWADPVEWRPREYNKRADHLCNQCLDTCSSYEYIDPDVDKYSSLGPNWLLYTDGGCRKQGSSSYAWVVYAVIEAGGRWFQFNGAFGYTFVKCDQSSFIVEAQALEKGLEVVKQVIGII